MGIRFLGYRPWKAIASKEDTTTITTLAEAPSDIAKCSTERLHSTGEPGWASPLATLTPASGELLVGFLVTPANRIDCTPGRRKVSEAKFSRVVSYGGAGMVALLEELAADAGLPWGWLRDMCRFMSLASRQFRGWLQNWHQNVGPWGATWVMKWRPKSFALPVYGHPPKGQDTLSCLFRLMLWC